jgi:saccharopine dehydrogenase-like NADP-dependent oxidoreductase
MFNLFKKNENKQSVNEVIAEIHDTFFSEVDRISVSAKKYHSLETNYKELIEKSERLKKLGFLNTQEVQQAQQEISRLEALKKRMRIKSSYCRQ